MDLDVAIVGAGHNGLAAATYLARAGLSVHLFECRAVVGGASVTEELWPGFHFSTCAHMIHCMHPRIIRDLGLYERGMQVLPRSFVLAPLPDGSYHGPTDHESTRNLSFSGNLTTEEREGERRYIAFLQALRRIFAPYRLQPAPSLAELRAKLAGSDEADVLEKALVTRTWEVQDEFLPTRSLRDKHAVEGCPVARNPLMVQAAASSTIEPDEETGEPAPNGYVRGGMGTVSRLMAEAAQEAGATIHLNRRVERFLVEDETVIGIRFADGSDVRSRIVVSNLDPKSTFLKLMPREHIAEKFRSRVEGLVTNVSSYKLLAAITELPRWKDWDGDPDLPSAGCVRFTVSREAVAGIYDDMDAGRPPRAPIVSFSVPSTLDDTLAPPGYHTASLWIFPAPARLDGCTWDDVRERVAEQLIDQITAYAPNFRNSIRDCKFRTPLDMERENGLTDGCIWHIQHTADQLFWNRPLPELAAYRAPLKGLYLCGAGQHPGGEVSGAPGHNAAQEILKDLK